LVKRKTIEPSDGLELHEELKIKQEKELKQVKPVLKDVDRSLANILIELLGV